MNDDKFDFSLKNADDYFFTFSDAKSLLNDVAWDNNPEFKNDFYIDFTTHPDNISQKSNKNYYTLPQNTLNNNIDNINNSNIGNKNSNTNSIKNTNSLAEGSYKDSIFRKQKNQNIELFDQVKEFVNKLGPLKQKPQRKSINKILSNNDYYENPGVTLDQEIKNNIKKYFKDNINIKRLIDTENLIDANKLADQLNPSIINDDIPFKIENGNIVFLKQPKNKHSSPNRYFKSRRSKPDNNECKKGLLNRIKKRNACQKLTQSTIEDLIENANKTSIIPTIRQLGDYSKKKYHDQEKKNQLSCMRSIKTYINSTRACNGKPYNRTVSYVKLDDAQKNVDLNKLQENVRTVRYNNFLNKQKFKFYKGIIRNLGMFTNKKRLDEALTEINNLIEGGGDKIYENSIKAWNTFWDNKHVNRIKDITRDTIQKFDAYRNRIYSQNNTSNPSEQTLNLVDNVLKKPNNILSMDEIIEEEKVQESSKKRSIPRSITYDVKHEKIPDYMDFDFDFDF